MSPANVATERTEEPRTPNQYRVAGAATLAAALLVVVTAFVGADAPPTETVLWLVVATALLLAVGVVGAHARYRGGLGVFGHAGGLLTTVGLLAIAAGATLYALGPDATVAGYAVEPAFDTLVSGVPAVRFLAVYGVAVWLFGTLLFGVGLLRSPVGSPVAGGLFVLLPFVSPLGVYVILNFPETLGLFIGALLLFGPLLGGLLALGIALFVAGPYGSGKSSVGFASGLESSAGRRRRTEPREAGDERVPKRVRGADRRYPDRVVERSGPGAEKDRRSRRGERDPREGEDGVRDDRAE